MSKALALVVLLGCSVTKPSAPVFNHAPPPSLTAFELANRLITKASTLDYSATIGSQLKLRQRALVLYDAACETGEPRACILALALPRLETEPMSRLQASCRNGHRMSCRAVAISMLFEDQRKVERSVGEWPGLEGITRRCRDGTRRCNWKLVRAECSAGWPLSCTALMAGPNYVPVYRWRAYLLAREGCDAGIIAECYLITGSPSEYDRLFAETRLCRLIGKCFQIGEDWFASGQLTKARDALELDCQTRGTSCSILGGMYVRGDLPEPVSGRGRALLEFGCRIYKDGCDLLVPSNQAAPRSTAGP